MSVSFRPLARLQGAQLEASSPDHHASLSASAGTGKTHVLTARVLRLLLAGVEPSSILCLTFTKAGASEMADRIHARLAHWVRLKDSVLGAELAALAERESPEMRANARRLFARVLDSTGGGLRILTIHAFAQSLLAAFPAEAGLLPGFRPMEGREEQQLARTTLAELLVAAEAQGDLGLVRDVQALSLRLGEGGAESFLIACARAPDDVARLGMREGIEAKLRRAFDLPLGDLDEILARSCSDEMFDILGLRRIGTLNREWGTRTGIERAKICEAWLDADPAGRVELLHELHKVFATSSGTIRSFERGQAKGAGYEDLARAAFDCCAGLISLRARAALVADLAAGLRAGQAFAAAYQAAKSSAGLADFDDLIRWTRALLATPGMGDWVRYKLDQRTDHILVDEAQDTNEAQWEIVGALVEEFFAGQSASNRRRTLFTVGDFKQAIFGFQGTDPREFEKARRHFSALSAPLREEALLLRAQGRWPDHDRLPSDFLNLSGDLSYRSSPPILAAVDQTLVRLGPEGLGLPRPANAHEAHHSGRTGSVTLWSPIGPDSPTDEEGEEGWISETIRFYANRLARQVARWIEDPFFLQSQKRAVRPEDILILVRSRSELASLLVARLHAQGVPVAGVDRLLLSAPLAVQDLLAAARFAIQPLDDLNLAGLLVSPLIGWDQDQLHRFAAGRQGALWPHLRQRDDVPADSMNWLQSILAMADFTTPHLFFERLLSGPLRGRARLLERLGPEARDPIEELLTSTLDFESRGSASLQQFLDWFSRGDVEIVRDPSGPRDAVRVMTVHGSKGLQAPVVILADACADPARARALLRRTVKLDLGPGQPRVPIFRPRKAELAEPLKSQIEAQEQREQEEHWRLLYVGMTRAEERLYIGGTLGQRDKGPPEGSWFSAVEASLSDLGCAWTEDGDWGRELRLGDPEWSGPRSVRSVEAITTPPAWLSRSAPAEPRPPRPLAPSSLGENEIALPPPGPMQRQAALRGRLLHLLFERIPQTDPSRREALALEWLERSAGVGDEALRHSLVLDATRIIDDPRFARLFAPESLAEAPLAAVIEGGTVVSGTVDRLWIGTEELLVADFKTSRSIPADPADIPPAHLRQMAAYRAALRTIYPDRRIITALLYTAAPLMHLLPDALLDAQMPGLARTGG